MIKTSVAFFDLDGTLIAHCGSGFALNEHPVLLPGVREMLVHCHKNDIKIIITTGRRESDREQTVKQLQKLNLSYDKIIFDCGAGKRYIFNDRKPNSDENTAIAINLERNNGMEGITI